MYRFIFLLLSTAVFSFGCHHAATAPTDQDIEEAIKEMYAHMSSADGGGGYHINNIEIIEKKPSKEPNHFLVKIKASGTYVHPPLANSKPDEDYSDTRDEELVYKNGRWTWFNKNE